MHSQTDSGEKMRTTLDIDQDVLAAVKVLARRRHLSAGKVVSNLLRQALTGKDLGLAGTGTGQAGVGGFRPFPPRGAIITDELIDALRDAEGV
jgi:hypothetical protein